MNTLTIENKKYVVIPVKDYQSLLEVVAKKSTPVRKLSLSKGKKHAYALIDKWAKEK